MACGADRSCRDEARKRSRAANFTLSEKTLLVRYVAREWSVLRNKRNDSASNNSKRAAWRRIAAEFNANNPHYLRKVGSLRKFWESLKNKRRKAIKLRVADTASGEDDGAEREEEEEEPAVLNGAGEDPVQQFLVKAEEIDGNDPLFSLIQKPIKQPAREVTINFDRIDMDSQVKHIETASDSDCECSAREPPSRPRPDAARRRPGAGLLHKVAALRSLKLKRSIEADRRLNDLRMERERLAVEREKVALEKERLSLQRERLLLQIAQSQHQQNCSHE